MKQLTTKSNSALRFIVDLNDERAVTNQCFCICADAIAYIDNMSDRASTLLYDNQKAESQEMDFEAQTRTRETLDKTRKVCIQASTDLLHRLESLKSIETSEDDRVQLKEDLEISQQYFSVYERASKMSYEQIFKLEEIFADENSDAMTVNTLADLFDVGKITLTNNSTILVGSMTDESLRDITARRYNSWFGEASWRPGVTMVNTTEARLVSGSTRKVPPYIPLPQAHEERNVTPELRPTRVTSNEVKRRASGGEYS